MILSNRKLKLIIIALLLFIFATFLGMLSPKALTASEFTNNGTWIDTSIDSGYNTTNIRFAPEGSYRNIFSGLGEGYALFTFQTSSYGSATTSQLTEVYVTTTNSTFTCEIGTTNGYLDSQMQIITFTAKCPINLPNSNTLNRIYWTRGGGAGKLDIRLGSVISFISKDSASSSSVIQADLYTIQQYQIDINNNISQFKNATHQDLEALKTALQSNNTAITNIQNNVSDIKDTINDSSIDTNQTSTDTSSWSNMNTSNGTITNLLTLPITLLQKIVSGLQTTCSPFSLGTLFETTITLPCINIGNLIGNGLWTTIDILFSGFMILSIAKKLIKIFNDFTNLKTNQIDEIYGGGSK